MVTDEERLAESMAERSVMLALALPGRRYVHIVPLLTDGKVRLNVGSFDEWGFYSDGW